MWKKTCKIRIKTKTKAKSSLVGERKKNPLAMSLRKKLSFVKLAYPVAQKKKEKKGGWGGTRTRIIRKDTSDWN